MRLPLLALGALAVALVGCGHGVETPPGQNDFFVTWEIDSLAFGSLDCASAGAATVELDVINVDSGARFVSNFVCAAYQGTSGPVESGRLEVLVNLADPSGAVIDQVDIGVEDLTEPGTLDLGHVIFRLQ